MINTGEDVEKREPSYTVGGNINQYSHQGEQYGESFKKLELELPSFSLVQFSHSVMSNSLQPHGLQHYRHPCPLPSSRGCSKSCPLSHMMPSNRCILCHPLLLLPSIFPSIRVFSNESALQIRQPKQSGLISFRIDRFDLLAVQGTLKSLLQHHSSKGSILGTQPSLWSNYHIHT